MRGTITVNADFARRCASGQGQTFQAWAKQLIGCAALPAEAARAIRLATFKHCERLLPLFERGLTPEQAAAGPEVHGTDWRNLA